MSCGSRAGARLDVRTCGGSGAAVAANCCNGTPPSTTGWRDAAARTLIGMIDDASSELLARFVRHDSSEENRRLLRSYLEQNLHRPRRDVLNTPKNSAGEDPKTLPPTQIGRALQELGIEPITAYSPQAKGRVERSFSTAGPAGERAAPRRSHHDRASQRLSTATGGTPRCGVHRPLGPEHDLDSALRCGSPTTTRSRASADRPQDDCAGSSRAVWTASWRRTSTIAVIAEEGARLRTAEDFSSPPVLRRKDSIAA